MWHLALSNAFAKSSDNRVSLLFSTCSLHWHTATHDFPVRFVSFFKSDFLSLSLRHACGVRTGWPHTLLVPGTTIVTRHARVRYGLFTASGALRDYATFLGPNSMLCIC